MCIASPYPPLILPITAIVRDMTCLMKLQCSESLELHAPQGNWPIKATLCLGSSWQFLVVRWGWFFPLAGRLCHGAALGDQHHCFQLMLYFPLTLHSWRNVSEITFSTTFLTAHWPNSDFVAVSLLLKMWFQMLGNLNLFRRIGPMWVVNNLECISHQERSVKQKCFLNKTAVLIIKHHIDIIKKKLFFLLVSLSTMLQLCFFQLENSKFKFR